ncbi:MAG: hypothetical protein LPH21_19310 [Shewanella sp.]|nr:hypothetical protein [Shewanella sp.]
MNTVNRKQEGFKMFRCIFTDANDKAKSKTLKTEKAVYRSVMSFLDREPLGHVTVYDANDVRSFDAQHLPEEC